MTNEIYLLMALIVGGFALLFWWLNRKLSEKQDQTLVEWLKSMQTSVEGTSKNLQDALAKTNKNIADTLFKSTQSFNERLDNAGRYISQVAKEVGKMTELNQSLRDLQVFLQSPKLRGNIGEQVLKDLVSQAFPKESFFLQYAFRSGEKVDAAIKTAAGILPIDSKFPLENFKRISLGEAEEERVRARREFRRDVKKHIKSIAEKYILTDEGTLDFAFMYLPSEMVFNEVANDTELLEYARQRRVYPVSPNTLYVHLQTVMLSFEGQKFEARSREVFRLLRSVQREYQQLDGVLGVMSKHVTNAYNQLGNVNQSFGLLGQKLSSARLLSTGETDEKTEVKEEIDE